MLGTLPCSANSTTQRRSISPTLEIRAHTYLPAMDRLTTSTIRRLMATAPMQAARQLPLKSIAVPITTPLLTRAIQIQPTLSQISPVRQTLPRACCNAARQTRATTWATTPAAPTKLFRLKLKNASRAVCNSCRTTLSPTPTNTTARTTRMIQESLTDPTIKFEIRYG